MPKVRAPSRPKRWAEAISIARNAVYTAIISRDLAVEAIGELRSIQEEFESWRDNLPENMADSALSEKLSAVCDIDLEPDTNDLDAMSEAINEAESAELPLGFGRD